MAVRKAEGNNETGFKGSLISALGEEQRAEALMVSILDQVQAKLAGGGEGAWSNSTVIRAFALHVAKPRPIQVRFVASHMVVTRAC